MRAVCAGVRLKLPISLARAMGHRSRPGLGRRPVIDLPGSIGSATVWGITGVPALAWGTTGVARTTDRTVSCYGIGGRVMNVGLLDYVVQVVVLIVTLAI
jgi:hypothetical protein